ncbi:MAG: ACP phosphodiesterase [Cytophagaceae bacterium]|nr:ACP phosphodiesterase [Cytophagaceae bacterium]MDW8456351.1 ACP phosphodiesterase [Cytophagaceae bacterium]
MNSIVLLYNFKASENDLFGAFISSTNRYTNENSYEKYPSQFMHGIIEYEHQWNLYKSHISMSKGSTRFKTLSLKYANMIIPLFHNHFFIKELKHIDEGEQFLERLYKTIKENLKYSSPKIQRIGKKLLKKRSIESIGTISGLSEYMEILYKTAAVPIRLVDSTRVLLDNYECFEEEYSEVFNDLVKFEKNMVLI